MSTPMGQTNMGTNAGAMGESHGSGQGQGQMSTNRGSEHREGPIARTIEQQTAKLPSDTFLWAAIGSIGASAILRLMGKKHASLFVGEWAAPMLLLAACSAPAGR